jgi:hypothetical protein
MIITFRKLLARNAEARLTYRMMWHTEKVKLFLYLIKHYALKTYGGVEVYILPPFLTSTHVMEVSSQLHAAPVLPAGKQPLAPIV